MKNRTLVIGFGNPLRGDDGFGWEVAARLTSVENDGSIEVLTVHQLTPEMIETLSQFNQVIFIDASCEGIPGEWRCDPVSAGEINPNALGHRFGIPELLGHARKLYGSTPQALLISVSGESFECRDHLTPRIEAGASEVVAYIRNRVSFAV
jgi:hydrogenase maturation protease